MKVWHQERHSPEPGTPLCRVVELADGEARIFVFGDRPKTRFRMFLHKDGGEIRAYMNACPHFNVPLNMDSTQLFTSDYRQFMCSIHYAKFNIEDGVCTEGPCEGLALERIPLEVVDGELRVGQPDGWASGLSRSGADPRRELPPPDA